MFVLSFKTSKKRLLCLGGFAAFTLVFLVGLFLLGPSLEEHNTEEKVRILLLEHNWKVDPASQQVERVELPEQFNETYERYNQLQRKQGYDLSDYRGKECVQYSFAVENRSGYCCEAEAWVLTYKGKIVGADVHSTEQGVFQMGLNEEKL